MIEQVIKERGSIKDCLKKNFPREWRDRLEREGGHAIPGNDEDAGGVGDDAYDNYDVDDDDDEDHDVNYDDDGNNDDGNGKG
jgi:hypothetical protein